MDARSHLTDEELLLAQDGDLSPEQNHALAMHVSTCLVCQHRGQALRAFSDGLARSDSEDGWTADAARGRARTRLRTRLADELDVRPAGMAWTSRAPVLVGVVATLVAAVFVAAGLPWLPHRAAPSEALAPVTADVRVLPIREFTPGATRALSAQELCARMPWQAEPIPFSVRSQVLRAYAMADTPEHEYELDYLVTPDLGGVPDLRNVWPEPYGSPVWNARVKDELETLLPRLVCGGELDLTTAQHDIETDWVAAYKKYFRTDRPVRMYSLRTLIRFQSPFDLG